MSDEYDLHIDRATRDRLWDLDEGLPFGEDDAEIEKLISEECRSPRRRKRKKTPQR